MRVLFAFIALLGCAQGQKQPFTADAMMRILRISEPQLSPDGKLVALTVDRPEVDENKKPKQIYVVPLAGGPAVAVTRDGTMNYRPRWTPDSQRIVFISNRSGSSQIWSMAADGSDPKQLTSLSTDADGVTVSPDGKLLLFTSEVYPDCKDDACNKSRLEAEKLNKVKARVYSSLLYRHWTDWQGSRRKHLMIAPIEGGPARDLTPGPMDAPTWSLGGPDDYAFSRDSKEVAYVTNTDEQPSTSTNTDIFVVPVEGGEPKRLTLGPGAERSPVFSPDGKYLAFRSQSRAGYESDRWRLAAIDRATGQQIMLNEGEDRLVDEFTYSPDSTRIFYVTEDRGRGSVQMMNAAGGGSRAVVTGTSHVSDVQFTPDGKTMVYSEQSGSKPAELFKVTSGAGGPMPLTRLNDELLEQYQLPALDEFWVKAGDQARIHTFLLKPPGFRTGRKYPMLLLIHGGPQGAWGHAWSYRWNAQVFAAAGYVVVMPNPRGSVGYGQKFTDEINGDWGGKPYDDLMKVVEHVAGLPYVDPERMAAAGASYGGYMVNWLLGRTQQFKALVSHAGVFDLRSMAGETEELWFPIWEFQGMPWDNPDLYTKQSPGSYAKEFKTPTLVTHGELDYRVPVGQGMQLFTALQLQKVPSKLVVFPDEGHWILKPQNSLFWYRNVLDWLNEWTSKPVPPPATPGDSQGPTTTPAAAPPAQASPTTGAR